jgi:hypothetical protein
MMNSVENWLYDDEDENYSEEDREAFNVAYRFAFAGSQPNSKIDDTDHLITSLPIFGMTLLSDEKNDVMESNKDNGEVIENDEISNVTCLTEEVNHLRNKIADLEEQLASKAAEVAEKDIKIAELTKKIQVLERPEKSKFNAFRTTNM